MRKRVAFGCLLGVAVGLTAGLWGPSLVHRVRQKYRPAVPTDWLKARCFEFHTRGPESVPWESTGPGRWYFSRMRFGARWLPQSGLLVFAPDGDGPRAYVLTADGKVLASFDDAVSVGCTWRHVNGGEPPEIDVSRWEPVRP